jgi:hypothetical protein
MAGREVAHGEVNIEVNDRAAIAALRHVDEEYDRTMKNIDRQRAEATIGADLSELRRNIKEAEAELQNWEKLDAHKKLTVDERQARDAAKRQLDDLKRQQAEQDKLLDKRRAENRQLALTDRELQAISKRERDRARIMDQADRRREQALTRQARSNAALNKQRERELAGAEKLAYQEEKIRAKTAQRINDEQRSIPKLQRQYVELVDRVEKLDSARRRAARGGDERATLKVHLQQREAIGEMARIKEELERIGGPIDLPIKLHPGRAFGQTMRREVLRGLENGGIRGAVRGAGIALGTQGGDSFNRGLSRALQPRRIGNFLVRGLSKAAHALEGLSSATIRLGPFTTSIKGMVIGLSILGPAIIDIVGALGSLVSVVGSAAGGLGALSAGFLGGAIPAALGFVAVLKPLVTQFKSAMTASKAYNDAVAKHGKNSSQAAAKQKELNNVLAGTSKQTRAAFKEAGTLSKRWKELTAPARAAAFGVIGSAIHLASRNLASFAARTNTSFKVVGDVMQNAFQRLGSKGGQQILGTMMDNFNAALGPALRGVVNLADALGRVGAIGSSFLPGFARQFEAWSNKMLTGAKNTDNMRAHIQSMVESLRAVGRFSAAAGRLMTSFFAGGVKSGRGFVDTMTNAMNRWSNFLQTTKGQQSLEGFFSRSVGGAKALFGALAPIVSMFVKWAGDIAPIAQAFFRVTGAVTGFVNKLMSISVLRGPISAMIGTLGALWAVNRIGAATQAVVGFTKALLGMKTAEEGLAAAQGIQAVASEASGAAGGMRLFATEASSAAGGAAVLEKGAVKTGARVGILRAAATEVVPAIAGMGAIAGGAATLGVGALAAAAVYGVYKIDTWKGSAEKARDSLPGLAKNAAAASRAFSVTSDAIGSAGGQLARSNLTVKQARQELRATKKGTEEHKVALLDYADALNQQTLAQKQWNTTARNYRSNAEAQIKTDQKRQSTLKQVVDHERKQMQTERMLGSVSGKDQDRYTKDKKALDRLNGAIEHQKNLAAAVGPNLQRAYGGLPAVTGKAADSLGELARQSKSIASKVSLKFEMPQDVGKVSRAAGAALKSGVPKKVTSKIVADSKSAEEAVKRLQKAKITPKRLSIVQKGGPEALKWVTTIAGRKLTPKESRIISKGGPNALAMLQRIIGRKISDKIFAIVARDRALALARKIMGVRIANKLFGIIAHDHASSPLEKVIGLMNALHDKTVSITTQYRQIGHPNPHVGAHAEGGYLASGGGATGATPDIQRLARAAEQAARAPVRDATPGRKVSRPTRIVGEENRPEYVIATNPRYRRRNVALLKDAANALNIPMPTDPRHAAWGEHGTVEFAAAGSPGQATVGMSRKKRKGKGRFKPLVKGMKRVPDNPHWNNIANARDAASDLEHKVSIAERNVREPDDFVIEHKDPTTGNTTYSFDQGAWNTYSNSVAAVRSLDEQLRDQWKAVSNEIGPARRLNDQQISIERNNIKLLKREIAKEEARQRYRPKKKGKAERAHAQRIHDNAAARLRKLRPALSNANQALTVYTGRADDLAPDKGKLSDEAFWAWRDVQQDIDDLNYDLGQKHDAAVKDINDQNAQGSGTGGAGGDQGVTYQGQKALVDTAKAEVLKSFGGNMAALPSGQTPSTVGGPGGGQGMGTNPAQVPSPPGRTAATSAAVGGALTRSSTSAAMAGGAGAAAGISAGGAGGAGGAAVIGGGDVNKEVNITNNYAVAPEDPHTYSAGMQFEMEAAI